MRVGSNDLKSLTSLHCNDTQQDYATLKKLKKKRLKKKKSPGIVVLTCNSSTWEAEAGGLGVPNQPGLRSQDLVSKKKRVDLSTQLSIHLLLSYQHLNDKFN
jgi:hypothetical protein